MLKAIFLVLISSMVLGVKAQGQTLKACILVYESHSSVAALYVRNNFTGDRYRVYYEAVPSDLLKCLQLPVEDIVLIAHAVRENKDSAPRLAYLKKGIEKNWEFFPTGLFYLFYSRIAELKKQDPGNPLKNFRWATCDAEKVLSYYPGIKELSEVGVHLDVAPADPVWSYRLGVQATVLDLTWLLKSH